MNPFEWSAEHVTGIEELDVEHRAFFRIAEELYDKILAGSADNELVGLFARPAAYAKFHFENEETLMQRSGFPEYSQHLSEHKNFLARITSLQRLPQAGNDLPRPLLEFLQSWLAGHVSASDRRLANYITGGPPVQVAHKLSKGDSR